MNLLDILQYIDSQKRQAGGLLKDIAQNPMQGLSSLGDRINYGAREYNREMDSLLGSMGSVRPDVKEVGLEGLLGRLPLPNGIGMIKAKSKIDPNVVPDSYIAQKFWDALDDSGDRFLGVRGDDAVIQGAFRNSWNRPDGVKTTRLPGVSVVGVGTDNLSKEWLEQQVKKARKYGSNVYLVEGDVPPAIQYLANDIDEKLLTNNRIISSVVIDDALIELLKRSGMWP